MASGEGECLAQVGRRTLGSGRLIVSITYMIAINILTFANCLTGLSGFAAAHVLSNAGHRVRVLEKHTGIDSGVGGAVRVPPNLSKILQGWLNPGQELAQTAVRCVGTPWHDLETGQRMGYMRWIPPVMHESGGEFLLMHYEDLHQKLYHLAIASGARVDFGCSVTSVRSGSPRPTLTLSTGETLTADIIIGADGPASTVRQGILGKEENKIEYEDMCIFTATIPAQQMLKDPELSKWIQADEWPIFMGPNRSVGGHPIRGKQEFAVQIYWPSQESGAGVNEPWQETLPAEHFLRYNKFAPSIRRLLQLVPRFSRSRWMHKPKGFDRCDVPGRIVLLGEAAHPWLPGGTYGPSIAIEGAVVFGSLFSHLRLPEQIPIFVHAYQELRAARCNDVLLEEIAAAKLMWLPPGPVRDARDADMGQPTEPEWDETVLRRDLLKFSKVFLYDARDAAEEWWINWGRLDENERDRATMHTNTPAPIGYRGPRRG